MLVKAIEIERFQDYKLPCMFIATCFCDWKCCKEQGIDSSICQNSILSKMKNYEISEQEIYHSFVKDPITKAVVIGGLEPIKQQNEIKELVAYFRNHGEQCPFVIYTGYYPDEISDFINEIKRFSNIIIKFGRFIPNKNHIFDDIIGVELASDNQYAKKIS